MPTETILAEAPIGVIFPPNVAPIKSPNNKSSGLAPIFTARIFATGIIAVT